MSGYGLQRGIDGSEAKHISTRKYYRDLMQQTEQLQTDIAQLQDRKETAQEELRQVKKEVQIEKLKEDMALTVKRLPQQPPPT